MTVQGSDSRKKQTKDKNKNNSFYSSVIAQRAARELNAREDAFEETHKNDTDNELIAFFHQSALHLGHTPRLKEIEGWRYLEKRFGSWDRLLVRSRLKPYSDGVPESEYALIKNERERQIALHKERKRQRKIKAAQRIKQQAQRKKEQEAYLAEHPEARKKRRKKNRSQKTQIGSHEEE